MEKIRKIEKITPDSDTDAVVIGGGIMGTLSALKMAEMGMKVEVFDMLSEGATSGNASYAAAAQFLPFVSGENPAISTPNVRMDLPFQISYLPFTLQGFRASQEYYRSLTANEATGITPMEMVEPKDPQEPWEVYLQRIMEPLHKIIWEPVDLEMGNGSTQRYWDYYQCSTLAINPVRTLPYFQQQLIKSGGIWHYSSEVTANAVSSFVDTPMLVAAGYKGPAIYQAAPYPYHTRTGMSAVFEAKQPFPDLPMLSFDDIVFLPDTSDRRRLTVGGLDLEKDYGANEQVAINALKRRIREISSTRIGPWTGFPSELLDNADVTFRVGTRSLGMLGIRVTQDSRAPHIVSIEDAGSIGWTLAPYTADLAARFMSEIRENFQPGSPDNKELLLETGLPEYPCEPRTSFLEMHLNPSADLRKWRSPHSEDYKDLLVLMFALSLREAAAQLFKDTID